MNGLKVVDNGSQRSLIYNDKEIAKGGNENRLGLYATTDGLFFDGTKIANPQTNGKGFYILNDKVMFGNEEVNSNGETDAPVLTKYWTPPTQEPSTYKPWDYRGLIADNCSLV